VGAGPPALGRSSPVRLREGEGARDAGSMTDPRALKPCGSRAARPRAGRSGLSARCCRLFGLQRRKTAAFPASRARCLRLAPWDPRWSDFSGTVPFSHFSGSRTYPPLWDLADANAVGRCERICRPIPWRAAGAPGPHGLGRRDGWCVPPAAATAPTGPDVSGTGPEGRGAHLRGRSIQCCPAQSPDPTFSSGKLASKSGIVRHGPAWSVSCPGADSWVERIG
jgi:hypothetical protein